MKTINLIYNSKGFLEEQYEDGNFYIAKEEDKALIFKATFPASLVGSVRAYLQFRGGGDVVECGNININSHTVECAVDAKYLSYNFLKIGFEVITATKEIRFEPVTIEVDEFVNIGGKSSAEGYTVTVKVGNVTKLAPGEEPYVANSGTAKDVVLNFGIPKGDKPEKGTDYFTADEQQGFKADILADIDLVLNTKADKQNEWRGFEGGDSSSATTGGAIGYGAQTREGGAVGWGAVAAAGFSGGRGAKVGRDDQWNYIDAIQLGKGTNYNPKTLQIYEHTLMNEDGTIPEERLTKAKAYTDEKASEFSSAITTLEKNSIECTSSGTTINVKDSAEAKPRGLKLYGKTIQGENPTPENPQELISIGDSGKVDVELYGKNLWDKDTAVSKFEVADDRLSYSVIPIRVGIGNTVTVSYKQDLPTGLKCSTVISTSRSTPRTDKWIYHDTSTASTNKTVTITATEEYIYLYTVTWYISGTPRFMQYIGNDLQVEISPSATDYESYKKQSISIPTPDGLLGIPVTSGGNYTDENGQQWICDEVDVENKVHIHRLEKFDSYNGEEITTQYMSTTGELSIGATVIYVLEIPYETPLTDEEKTACKEFTMYKPVTNIFNSDNAQMKVDYVADTKTYVDNKFTELQNAIISTGGNV